MNPSYSECAFKLHLPTYVAFDEGIQINNWYFYRSGECLSPLQKYYPNNIF